MIEVRAYTSNVETSKVLEEIGCIVVGDYAFRDYIYQPKSAERYDLNKEFVRIRFYHKTNWNQKSVELSHKVKSPQNSVGVTKMKHEFDSLDEALTFLNGNFIETFSFQRSGIEYKYNRTRLFLEDIEGLPQSIEIIAPSVEDVNWIFGYIHPSDILSDSVPMLIERLKRNSGRIR